MNYGFFDDANREYVITNPHTPVKWINYVGTLAFGGIVDQTGGALICKGDPALNRITKYIPQTPDADFKGETLYLRLHDGDSYRLFSAFITPTLHACDHYECRVGMGYSRITTESCGIRAEITIFVPRGEARVIRDIRLTNLQDAPVTLDAIPVVEYSHFDALKQLTNADWVPQTMQSAARHDGEHLILAHAAFMNWGRRVNYFTSNAAVSSFESDRAVFLGRGGTGSWACPQALLQPELSNTEARRGDNIAALLHHLGPLAPGETRRIITQLGQEPDLEQALPRIRRYYDSQAVDAAFAALHNYWDAYLSSVQVDTPDPAMNSMLNVFNPRQCHTTKNWSRYLSLYQLGYGARGIGFRDSSQDVMGVLAHMPDEAKDLLRMLLSVQKRDGSAMHQFNPLTMEANEGDSREEEDRPHYYSDDHLWGVLAVCAYLKETGDLGFLDEAIPFYDKDRREQPIESAAVREHLARAIAFTRTHTGPHGLPLLGFADWNDTVNLETGAESLFTANLYGRALMELRLLFEHLGQPDAAADCQRAYDAMRECVNRHAWDGAWYVRYFKPDGTPLGSQHSTTGQIFTNGQSWPVLSGFAGDERAAQALEAVHERLNTAHGIKLSTPGYNGYDPTIGGVSTYPPGAKENGGIFLHANPWVIIAECIRDNAARAYQYYRQINPAAKNDCIDTYECEPYVYAQNILGDEHPQFGLGRNSWLSGTASWMYQAATQYILGVRPTYDGLQIAPCIPSDWPGFTMQRRFRGAMYHITVKNPESASVGVSAVIVNGQPISGSVIPVQPEPGPHRVEVVLGRR